MLVLILCIAGMQVEPSPLLLEALAAALSVHPQLSVRVCEAIAQLAKAGTCTQLSLLCL